jgi:hypothetical protein
MLAIAVSQSAGFMEGAVPDLEDGMQCGEVAGIRIKPTRRLPRSFRALQVHGI